MLGLNLTARTPKQLPASEFPEKADVYVCDKCGRDITKHLHRGRAHVMRPVGPVRYRCVCGEAYLSGASEWDYLGDWERRMQIRGVMAFSVAISVGASFLGLFPALVLYVFGLKEAALVSLATIAIAPLVFSHIAFWASVFRSIVRTRIRKG